MFRKYIDFTDAEGGLYILLSKIGIYISAQNPKAKGKVPVSDGFLFLKGNIATRVG